MQIQQYEWNCMQLECELRVCHTDQCPIASRPRSRRARARTHCSAQICRLTEPESLLEFATNLLRYLHWQVLRYLRQSR